MCLIARVTVGCVCPTENGQRIAGVQRRKPLLLLGRGPLFPVRGDIWRVTLEGWVGGPGSPGGQGGKDALGRRNSMDKDTEAGKTPNCSGNCKEVLHSRIHQADGQKHSWREGGQQRIRTDVEWWVKHFWLYSTSNGEPSICRCGFRVFPEE